MRRENESNGAAPDAAARSLAPAVSRAMRVLDLLAQSPGEPVSLAEIARSLGAAKSSTSNVCTVLEESRMISRVANGYVLGRRTVELGGAYLTQFDQIKEFYRICAESPLLQRQLVQLAVLHDREVIYLARHEGRTPLRLTSGAGVGDHYPAALTSIGTALLATLDPAQVTELYDETAFPALTARSTRSLEQLHAKLALTRERGYAVDEGEVFPNVVGIAMAIPPRQSGDHAFGINISRIVPTDPPTLSREELDSVVETLRHAVSQLTNPMALGTDTHR
ncbi:MAG: hypothetical protein BGO96_09125 [Micrococcales bacterium 73-15]|nr:MAG: hypothetical protein BGO96_09125 [Micrococcales bacterium 73-15]